MPLRRKYVSACCSLATVVTLLIAGSAALHVAPAHAQTQLGAHTLLKVGEGDGVNPAMTSPITTQASGSSLIVFNGGYTGNLTTPSDTYSNAWTQVGIPVFYNGYSEAFAATGYVSLAARGGANHTVSIAKPFRSNGEISLPFIEIVNAGVLHDVAQNYPASGLTLTSGSVTTTGPAMLVALWWGDGGVKDMTAVPNNGFTIIDSFLHLPDNSGVQCAVAVRQVNAAGTYNVTWTDNPSQGAILWLFSFQSRNNGSDDILVNGFDPASGP